MKRAVFGCIGAGYFANAQHLPNSVWAPHIELRTVCDIREDAVRAAQKKFNIPKGETDYRKVLADPEIDAVFVITRPEDHSRLTVEALKAGKHVYVEKPLAETLEECEAVIDAQVKAKRHVAVGFNRRFAPAYRKAMELLAKHGGAQNIFYRVTDTYSYTWGKNYPPGRRVFHETCHIFDALRWMTGSEPASVYCVEARADDEAIVVKFASGPVATIMSSGWSSLDWPKESLEVIAGKGGLTVDNFVELRTYGFGDAEDVYRFPGHVHPDHDFTHRFMFEALGSEAMRALYKIRFRFWEEFNPDAAFPADPGEAAIARDFNRHHSPHGYDADKGWRQAADHFAECILTGEQPENADARDGLIAEHMAVACAKSRETHAPVLMTEYGIG